MRNAMPLRFADWADTQLGRFRSTVSQFGQNIPGDRYLNLIPEMSAAWFLERSKNSEQLRLKEKELKSCLY